MSDNSSSLDYAEGLHAFGKAKRQAFWQDVLSHFNGKPTELLSFDEIRARLRLREEYYKGLEDVPLDRIVGSVGRYRDFTNNFLPKTAKMRERWSRVYAKNASLEGLPPIELYQVDDVYFVRDGNHRVSVARQLGAKIIQAYVIELPTSIDLEPGMSPLDIDVATAQADFLELTRLTRSRPHHQPIKLSEPERYQELLRHISVRRYLLERERGEEVTTEQAAADWYDYDYRPAITLIRKYGAIERHPDRTEGDMYVWLVEHLRDLREQYGDQDHAKRISEAIADFLAERKISVPDKLLSEDDDSVIVTKTQAIEKVEGRGGTVEAEDVDED